MFPTLLRFTENHRGTKLCLKWHNLSLLYIWNDAQETIIKKMEWVFNTFSEYLENDFKKRIGKLDPTVADLWQAFQVLFPATSAQLLVQEPVGNTVRFKPLAFYHADEMGPLIEAPLEYLRKNFGGGKFKINFYHGMQFIATINFKPEGPEIWRELPELEGNPVSDQ